MKFQLWMNGLSEWSWRQLCSSSPWIGSTNTGYTSRRTVLKAIKKHKKMTERANLRNKILHQEEIDL